MATRPQNLHKKGTISWEVFNFAQDYNVFTIWDLTQDVYEMENASSLTESGEKQESSCVSWRRLAASVRAVLSALRAKKHILPMDRGGYYEWALKTAGRRLLYVRTEDDWIDLGRSSRNGYAPSDDEQSASDAPETSSLVQRINVFRIQSQAQLMAIEDAAAKLHEYAFGRGGSDLREIETEDLLAELRSRAGGT